MTDEQVKQIKHGIIALLAIAIQIRDSQPTSIDQAVDKAQIFLTTVNRKIAEEGRE
jgi:hypothetical protein